MLIEDVKRIVHELDQGQQLSSIGVELVDNELAILYMNSKKSEVMPEPHPLNLHRPELSILGRFTRGQRLSGAQDCSVHLPMQRFSILPVMVQTGAPEIKLVPGNMISEEKKKMT